MIVDLDSSQNTQKNRRLCNLPCRVVNCNKNARDEIIITTILYDLIRLNVCKKYKKVYESRQTQESYDTDRKTVEDGDTVSSKVHSMYNGIDYDLDDLECIML